MAKLTTAEQQEIRRGLARWWSQELEPIGVTKPDLLAAVDALDTFFDDNAATINNALPAAAKTNLTTDQKAILTTAVIARRYNKQILVKLFGGVD